MPSKRKKTFSKYSERHRRRITNNKLQSSIRRLNNCDDSSASDISTTSDLLNYSLSTSSSTISLSSDSVNAANNQNIVSDHSANSLQGSLSNASVIDSCQYRYSSCNLSDV